MGVQPHSALGILLYVPGIAMLVAIELDRETDLLTEEIEDVGADRVLAAKFVVFEYPAAQAVPQRALNVRHRAPEPAGLGDTHRPLTRTGAAEALPCCLPL